MDNLPRKHYCMNNNYLINFEIFIKNSSYGSGFLNYLIIIA